jgi:hypothetical protein
MSVREVRESPWEQGADERRNYVLDTTPWGGSPSSPVVRLYEGDDEDVSGAKLDGSASVNGNSITTPFVVGLDAGQQYRLEIQFVVDGRVEEAYGHIICAR